MSFQSLLVAVVMDGIIMIICKLMMDINPPSVREVHRLFGRTVVDVVSQMKEMQVAEVQQEVYQVVKLGLVTQVHKEHQMVKEQEVRVRQMPTDLQVWARFQELQRHV